LTQDTAPDLENLSFEDAFAMLEETAQALESGGMTLTDSVDLYERGTKLARVCNERLTAAEARVSRIETAYGEQTGMIGDG